MDRITESCRHPEILEREMKQQIARKGLVSGKLGVEIAGTLPGQFGYIHTPISHFGSIQIYIRSSSTELGSTNILLVHTQRYISSRPLT